MAMNAVFIACSLDGYIADKNGSVGWLDSIEYPKDYDMGYGDFMSRMDALVMGRKSFETVCGFDVEWPYDKPVFVLSNTMVSVPEEFADEAYPVKGAIQDILDRLHKKGFKNLYIDGGKTIQSFLKEDLIDEMTITTIPILLGGGMPLFGQLDKLQMFECVNHKTYEDRIPQMKYVRKRG